MNIKDMDGDTPYVMVVKQGRKGIVELLKKYLHETGQAELITNSSFL